MISITIFLFFSIINIFSSKESKKLTGKPISSDSAQNLLEYAFDEDKTTEFKSTQESNGWIGLELDTPHRITKIGWMQKGNEISNYMLGIFEGANEKTFLDGIPLYMLTEKGKNGVMNYVSIDVNYSFKYIRYVGPCNKSSVITDLEFYGYEASTNIKENEEELYQPTNLPLVIIHTENSIDPTDKENSTNSSIVIIDNGKRDTKIKGTIKLRGNGSLKLLKKGYKIKFNSKRKILDLPAKSKKWNLIANHCDKTLIRNAVAFKISSLFKMKYTPNCKFVDLMLNGEYKGNYNLCDQIDIGKGRIEIEEMDKTCTEEPEISGGYLIEADGYLQETDYFINSTKGIIYFIRNPKKADITPEQINYFENKFNEIEEEVYSGIVDKIDIDSFVSYLLVQEMAENIDEFWSTYMYKERGDDKLYFGPVWDFDIAFANDFRTYPIGTQKNFIFKFTGSSGTLKEFVIKLLSNLKVMKYLKSKWKQTIEIKVIKKVLFDYIDEQVELIKESRKLNFMRWDALKRKINTNPFARCTYEEEVDFLKEFINNRLIQLDEIVDNTTIDSINENTLTYWDLDKLNKTSREYDYDRDDERRYTIGILDGNCTD